MQVAAFAALLAGFLAAAGAAWADSTDPAAALPSQKAVVSYAREGPALEAADELVAVRPMLISGVGLMQVPDLQEHLDAILARLESNLPGAHPLLHVYLTPVRSFVAEGGPDGGIFISMGTVEAIGSDDAIAFILGHELAHVWLGHFAHRVGTRQWEHSLSVLAQAGLRLSGGKAPAATGVQALLQPTQRNLIVTMGARDAADAVLFPSWARNQEMQADLVGVDLVAAAGYSPAGVDEVFDHLEAMDQARDAELARAGLATRTSEDRAIGQARDLKGVVDVGIKTLFARVGRGIGGVVQQARNEHGASSERHDRLAAYIDRYYPDVPATLRTASWQRAMSDPDTTRRLRDYGALVQAEDAFYAGQLAVSVGLMRQIDQGPIAAVPRAASLRARLVTAVGRTSLAQQILISSLRQPDVPLDNYIQLIRLDLQSRQLPQADAAVHFANGMLGSPRELYPTDLQILRAQNNQIVLDFMLIRCTMVGDDMLSNDCRAAAGK